MSSAVRLTDRQGERGAGSVEYGLVVFAIAAVIAMAVYAFGGTVLDLFGSSCDTLATTQGSADCAR